MGPSQICGCPFREPRVFTIAQMILDPQRAQEQRQQLLHHDVPTTGPTPPTPSPTSALPTTMPPPAPKARPTEPEAPDHRIVSAPAAPLPRHSHAPTSPSRRPRSRTRRSRSHRPSSQPPHRRHSPHRTVRPRSPLPRFRSSTKHDKDRRTPSPYRRRSPPRRRSPAAPRRHRSHPRPRSRTPRRHSRGREVVLRPATRPSNPAFIPTPDADDTWGEWNNSHYPDGPDDHHHNTTRPNSPAGPPPSASSTNPPSHPAAPLGAVAFRDFVSLTVTAKTQMQPKLFQSQNLTRMTSTSAKWLRRPMIHFGYDAWPSLTQTIQYPSAHHWTIPTSSSTITSLTRCSISWLNHIAPSTTNLFSSKQVKPPSRILPGPLHNPDYLTSSWQSKPKHSISSQRTSWPSRFQRGCPRNRSIVANTRAPTWSTTKRVGKQLPRSLLKIAFAGNLDQKRGRLPDSIPMLRVFRHVLWDSWHRWPPWLCCQVMYIPALPYRERTKPIWPIGHLSLPQMHAGPIWRKWPNSTLVQPTGHLQGQRQCNGYGLQCCINLLRCLYSLGFPRIDHTLGSGSEPTHCRSTKWTSGQHTSWSWTSSTTWPCRWCTCTFRSTTRRLSSDNQPPRDHRTYRTRSCSPTLERQPFVGQFNIPVETAVHPIVKATLEINAATKLDPAPRHTTTPDLAGKHFIPEEHLANCGLLHDCDPVSLVAWPILLE